jgi:GT2 family glycosyltransferase
MPHSRTDRSISIQSILYRTAPAAVERTLEAIDWSATVGADAGLGGPVSVTLGDASPERVLSDEHLDAFRERFTSLAALDYEFFGENTGTAKGHNRLAAGGTSAFIVTSNPDIVPDRRALLRMVALFDDPATGMVEAKQSPVEHPKEYDVATGETGWAATAFAMTRRDLFEELGGFDEQTFFMYCDDVDYSWLVRESGHRVIFQPAAVAYHDKRLGTDGAWQPTSAERYYSAQAALLLAHKWSREDVVARVASYFASSETTELTDAVAEFRRREQEGVLVPQRDPEHRVAEFHDNGYYTEHRFVL